ncbi:MAG TPA: AAA family ATPase [Terriglobales bacterium]|nr:AAA family ATPase [Terriglobales bacterium]
MSEIIKSILSGHNQFASGGLLIMIVGGLGVYLRALPEALWEWFVSQTTMMITVNDDDSSFCWVKEWLLEQNFLKRIRRVDLDTTIRKEELALIPAPGTHWFWHAGRPFMVHFYRNEDPKGSSRRRTESLTFHTIGRRQAFLKRFVKDIVECHEKNVRIRSSLFMYDDGWMRVEGYAPRLLDSVVLKPGEKDQLIQDIEKFRNSRQRYRRLGVPYHRGYLLYGPPGTGKTSLVSAIAARFEVHIYAINLSIFNDRTLTTAINDVPPNSVILFEDIDCMRSGNARITAGEVSAKGIANSCEDKKQEMAALGVTLSGLLNVIDGFSAPENVLFVMTSNVIESLDPALLRAGRVDYKLYMGQADDRQKIELYNRFFPEAAEVEAELFVEIHHSAKTMAEFQGLLLRLEQDCTELDELVCKV